MTPILSRLEECGTNIMMRFLSCFYLPWRCQSHYTRIVNTGHPTIRYWIYRMSNGLLPNYKHQQSAFSCPHLSWVDAQLTSGFRSRRKAAAVHTSLRTPNNNCDASQIYRRQSKSQHSFEQCFSAPIGATGAATTRS